MKTIIFSEGAEEIKREDVELFENITNLVIPSSAKTVEVLFDRFFLNSFQCPPHWLEQFNFLYPHRFIVSEGTTSITKNNFAKCQSIESLKLPISVKSIEDKTFKNFGKLSSLECDVSMLKHFAKNDISQLVLPEGVTSIGKDQMKDYDKLNELTLPLSLKTIILEFFKK